MGIPRDGTGINCYGMGQINMSHGQPCQKPLFTANIWRCCQKVRSCSYQHIFFGSFSKRHFEKYKANQKAMLDVREGVVGVANIPLH